MVFSDKQPLECQKYRGYICSVGIYEGGGTEGKLYRMVERAALEEEGEQGEAVHRWQRSFSMAVCCCDRFADVEQCRAVCRHDDETSEVSTSLAKDDILRFALPM